MDKWWQDPRLDDEGTYDYLVEELPSDSANWEWYYQKCDSCGKYHKLNFTSTHYFYCWDGWDSMSYTECWRCVIKDKIYGVKCKIKKKIVHRYEAIKNYCELMRKLKQDGKQLTREQKNTYGNFVKRRWCNVSNSSRIHRRDSSENYDI